MNFVVKADQDSRSSPNIVLFATDPARLAGIAARLLCDTIRQVFSLPKASNEVLQARARIRGCNIRTLNKIANKLFDSERYQVEQGLYVIDIVADDLVAEENEFAWGDSDLPGSAQQNINRVTITKFDKERDIVDRFLQLLGYTNYSLAPRLRHRTDHGVLHHLKTGGVQVRLSHPLFSGPQPPGGSFFGLRARPATRKSPCLTSGPTFVTLRPWKRTLSASDSGPTPRRAKSDFLSVGPFERGS